MTQRNRIIITGASSGLGEGMARVFAARGATVGLVARRAERLDALVAELGDRAHAAVADVTDPAAVSAAFADLADRMGGVDRVIVNAGIGKGAPIGTGHAAVNRQTIETNLLGALGQVEAAMEIFRAQGAGHLVLISSVAAARGMPKAQAAYSASKAGLTALGQGLQAELAGSGMVVTIIEPGFIDTDLTDGLTTPLMTDRAAGVEAIVGAIEAERRQVAVPRWPWAPIAFALRTLPDAITRRLV